MDGQKIADVGSKAAKPAASKSSACIDFTRIGWWRFVWTGQSGIEPGLASCCHSAGTAEVIVNSQYVSSTALINFHPTATSSARHSSKGQRSDSLSKSKIPCQFISEKEKQPKITQITPQCPGLGPVRSALTKSSASRHQTQDQSSSHSSSVSS